MRCLVTGASGHLGSFLTRLLLDKGHEIAICIRPQSDPWRISDLLSRVKVIYGDLSTVDEIADEVRSFAPETVFHLAWHGVTREYRNNSIQVNYNLIGSLKLLQIALDSGCDSWIGIGSQAEYGPYNGPLREDSPARPVTGYGVAKLCAGLLSRQLCDAAGARFIWFRLLATYGPKDDIRHFIPTVILKLLSSEKPLLTLGEQRWDYLYVEDASQAIYHAAVKLRANGVFNLASGESHLIRDIAERIRNFINPSLTLGFGEIPYYSDHIEHLEADITRLKQLDWLPRFSLNDGLKATISWYKTHRHLLAV